MRTACSKSHPNIVECAHIREPEDRAEDFRMLPADHMQPVDHIPEMGAGRRQLALKYSAKY